MEQLRELALQTVIQHIKDKTPVTFSRWGDGEWYSVLGRRHGRNCDDHDYFPKMGKELRNVLLSRPPYVLGLQNLALKVFDGKIEKWLQDNNLVDLDWVNADVFHNASGQGKLEPLLQALRQAKLVMIGPPHLAKLKKFLGYNNFVTVPPKNSYLAVTSLLHEIYSVLDLAPVGTVVSVSAGMPAKLLIDAMFNRYGHRHLLLDFGSVWDCYAGVKSRRYMQNMQVDVPEDKP